MNGERTVLFVGGEGYSDFYDKMKNYIGEIGFRYDYSLAGISSYEKIDRADLVALDLGGSERDVELSVGQCINGFKQTFGFGFPKDETWFRKRVCETFYNSNFKKVSENFDRWYVQTTPYLQKDIEDSDVDLHYGAPKISEMMKVSLATVGKWFNEGEMRAFVDKFGEGRGIKHGKFTNKEGLIEFLKKFDIWEWLGQKTIDNNRLRGFLELDSLSVFQNLIKKGYLASYSFPSGQNKVPELAVREFIKNKQKYVDQSGLIRKDIVV